MQCVAFDCVIDIPMEIDVMIAKASNIIGLQIFFHLHTNLDFEDQVKIAKLMSHSISLLSSSPRNI